MPKIWSNRKVTETKNKDAAGSSGAGSSARRKFRGAAMRHGSEWPWSMVDLGKWGPAYKSQADDVCTIDLIP